MQFIPIKTRVINPPQDDIYELLEKDLPSLDEGDVVFITAKILAIHQGRCIKIKKDDIKVRRKLAKQEADYYFQSIKDNNFLTIKDNILSRSSGIDKSNGDGYYVLWPKKTSELLKKIHHYLTKKNKLKKLAIIAIDSTTVPLRWGVTGISVGAYGIKPLKSAQGQPDIFGRKLKGTKINIVDSISAMANMVMGEGKEQTPIVIGRGLNFVEFTSRHSFKELLVDMKDDYYYPLFKSFKKNN